MKKTAFFKAIPRTTRLIETMAAKRKAMAKKAVANRHLVCCECSSWIQFDTLGCTIPWGEMKGNTVFKCKGCTEVARLVGEVEYLRKMVESLKRMVTGQGLDETSGETGDREAALEEAEEREKCVGDNTRYNSPQTGDRVARREEEKEKGEGVLTPYRSDDTTAEDRDAVIETDGEQGTEGDTSRRRMEAKICSGARIMATHTYKRNPDSPLGYEIDLQQEDVLSFIMEHEDNEHWWLAEDSNGQVGYVPVSHLMIIVDEMIQE